MKSEGIINLLLPKCDVLLLQETLIADHAFDVFCEFNNEFDFYAVSSVRNTSNFFGKSSGGLVILYRKTLSKYISPVYCSSRVMGIRIVSEYSQLLIINVYFTCDYRNDDSLASYQTTLSEIRVICESEVYDTIVISGDFNCDPNKGRFYKYFCETLDELSMKSVDILRLPVDSFTYISRNNTCSTSWLDHVVTNKVGNVSNLNIMHGYTFEDHVPVHYSVVFSIETNIVRDPDGERESGKYVLWNHVKDEHIQNYGIALEDMISMFSDDALLCSEPSCEVADHRNHIDLCYDYLINCIVVASDCFPHREVHKRNRNRAGWNDYCKALYKISRDKFLKWNESGRPRYGDIFNDMKLARQDFRRSMNFCRRNELRIRRNKIVESFHDKKSFWKGIKSVNGKKSKLVSCIDGESNGSAIIDVLDRKYKSVLCCESSQFLPEYFDEVRSRREHSTVRDVSRIISVSDVDFAIDRLNVGIGWDNVHTNHLKYSCESLLLFISQLFSSCIRHSYVPSKMLKGEIRPIVKNRNGDCQSSKNYRPIMNSSNLLKVFEYCLLPKVEKYFEPSSNQFGFRKNTSCLSAITVVKETIHYYNNQGSNVHCAKIDLSKAFDKLNHDILFCKMMNSEMPRSYIETIMFMLRNTNVCVSFGNYKGKDWKVGNGVRQGGILSPYIFNFYVDSVLHEISHLGVGCDLNSVSTNIICYADDILLCAPSQKGLQFLINHVCRCLQQIGLPLNDKSEYIVFKCKTNCNFKYSVVIDGNIFDNVDECVYLGVNLSSCFKIDSDIDRCMKSFLNQFNAFYHKFYFLNREVLVFLMQSYCMSMYGCELWYNYFNVRVFRKFSIAYHKTIKKIAGMAPWQSNHTACDITGFPILIHFVNNRILSHFFSIINSKSPCITPLKYYFIHRSFLFTSINKIFKNQYGISNVLDNDFMALKARIIFTQRNEERSFYGM